MMTHDELIYDLPNEEKKIIREIEKVYFFSIKADIK